MIAREVLRPDLEITVILQGRKFMHFVNFIPGTNIEQILNFVSDGSQLQGQEPQTERTTGTPRRPVRPDWKTRSRD